MKTNATTNSIAVEETARAFESDVANADTVRASALSGLQRLRAAKAKYAEREQIRLAAKLSDDHPDVIRLKAEVVADQQFGRELGAEVDRIQAAIPAGDKGSWVLHGFVRDQNLQGQANLTIALFNPANRWIEAIGHTCTDSRGYFKLRYAPGGKPVTEELREIFIRVSSQKQEVLYRDKSPMTPVLGEVKYREIILNGENAYCEPPSDAPSQDPPAKTSKPQKAKSTRNVQKDEKN